MLCTFSTVIRHRPGFLLTTTTRGAVQSSPGSTITCVGHFAGQELSSEPGALSVHGTYEGTCLSATAQARLRIEVVTVDGDRLVLQGPLDVTRFGLVVQGTGHLDTVPFRLAVVGVPDPAHPEENCVTNPLDHVLVTGVITINGAGDNA